MFEPFINNVVYLGVIKNVMKSEEVKSLARPIFAVQATWLK